MYRVVRVTYVASIKKIFNGRYDVFCLLAVCQDNFLL